MRTGRDLDESGGTNASVLLRAALGYAKRNVPVFPLEPAGKRPLTYSGFWEATTDARLIEAWWRRWPTANVGAPTGRGSGLLVLDVDPAAGGLESLADLERSNEPLPKTTRARTGGGGTHAFFRYPADEEVRNSAGWLGPGLDVRGEGGYVVVPPSRTKGTYEWLEKAPLAEPPAWLLARLRERGRPPQRGGEATLF